MLPLGAFVEYCQGKGELPQYEPEKVEVIDKNQSLDSIKNNQT